jgi:hypothetical protein
MESAGGTLERLLQEAEHMALAGNDAVARRLLGEALQLAPDSLRGWSLAARLAPSYKEEIYCLKRVLQINPGQAWAKARLHELGQLKTDQLASSAPRAVIRENDATASLVEADSSIIIPAATLAAPARPATVSLPAAKPAAKPAPRATTSRRRRTDPVFIFLCVMAGLFAIVACFTMAALAARFSGQEAIPTAIAPLLSGTAAVQTPSNVAEDCQALVARALTVAESSCSQLAPNQACYGNTQLTAELAPGASRPFQARGDIIGVDQLLRISASPLDLATQEWGVAIFKLLANVPRSLPGQNVTFIVFGNTSLNNASGDLRAFYFSSQLGQLTCARLPADGIIVHMPDGAGLTFSANGAAITLLGTAELKARPNEDMTVSVASGSASITADGQTQYFGAGQEVRMPLGGAGGLEPAGPPEPPSDIAAGSPATCAMLGVNCKPGDVQRIDPTQAASAIAQAVISSTPSLTGTQKVTATRSATPKRSTATPAPTSTVRANLSPVPSLSAAPSASATATAPGPSDTPAPTFTPSSTWTRAPTAIPSPTPSQTQPPSPTATDTPVPTFTPTFTFTPIPSPTDTPACQLSAGSLAVGGNHLRVRLDNQGSSPASILSMTLDWPDTPASQKIKDIHLGGNTIDNSNYNSPPSQIPLNGTWSAGHPADRRLSANSQETLDFGFQDPLPATGYNLAINFDNGCSVSASR